MTRRYRALMKLAPRKLRERHGREMEALFDERLAAARPQGIMAAAAVWLHAAADLIRARLASRAPERVQLTQDSRSPFDIRHS